MSEQIPEKFQDIFQKKSFAQLATVMPDGTPQVTPVWCDYDGTHVVVNSAVGRTKDKNVRKNKNVAVSVQDPDNPYRYVGFRGEVVEITETGADDHIDKLAKKYLDQDKYPFRAPGEKRVIYRVLPNEVWTNG